MSPSEAPYSSPRSHFGYVALFERDGIEYGVPMCDIEGRLGEPKPLDSDRDALHDVAQAHNAEFSTTA